MGLDGGIQVRGAAIVQQKDSLSQAPQGSGAELVASSAALRDVVRQAAAHVMDLNIRERIHRGRCSATGTKFDAWVEPGVALWQVAQPTDLNREPPAEIADAETCCPFSTTPPAGGGARNRMKLANAETSSKTAA